MSSHLVLIGFKHAGKSLLGENLSTRLKRPFVDLDTEIVRLHSKQCRQEESCREILHKHGDAFFRDLESEALAKILEREVPLVLALGGGTPLMEQNQTLLQGHELVHVAAPRSIVFERIMINGKPSFFSQEEDAFDQFQELWAKRIPLFDRLAKITVKNEGSIDALTDEVLAHLNLSQ
jgi:shikimate kinase